MDIHTSDANRTACPTRGHLEANLGEHLRLAELAASRGALVVLFPELSLVGYELDLAEASAAPDRARRGHLTAGSQSPCRKS